MSLLEAFFFYFFYYGCRFIQWRGTILAILVKDPLGNISVVVCFLLLFFFVVVFFFQSGQEEMLLKVFFSIFSLGGHFVQLSETI